MTLEYKIKELLNNNSEVCTEFFESNISDEEAWDSKEVTEFKDLLRKEGIKFEYVDNYGGEGMGDDYWSVYSFSQGDKVVYVKFQGWYASFNGSEYQEFYFVKPVQVMNTVFKQV